MRAATIAIFTAVAAMAGASSANAASISYSTTTTRQNTTYMNVAVPVMKFDPSLGVLTSVFLELNGTTYSNIDFESLNAGPSSVTSTSSAQITLSSIFNSSILSVTPVNSRTAAVTSYDGVFDFGGTSGRSFDNLATSLTASTTLTSIADLAFFTGVGNADLRLAAVGRTSATGPANLASSISTAAGAVTSVTYNYDAFVASVPEPATWATTMLGVGAIGAGLRRRRGKVTTRVVFA